MKWLHRLFNPHCPECRDEDRNEIIDVLQQQLNQANYNNERLIKYILEPKGEFTQASSPSSIEDEPEPVRPKIVPWHIRKKMLEEQDREKAKILRQTAEDQAKAIADLEKELKLEIPQDGNDVQDKSVG